MNDFRRAYVSERSFEQDLANKNTAKAFLDCPRVFPLIALLLFRLGYPNSGFSMVEKN